MGLKLQVRAADIEDDADLREVDRLTWSPHASPVPVPDWSSRPRFFTDDRGPDGFLVAEQAATVVGYVALHQESDIASHVHVLTVDGLAVLPAAQGRGVGRALVEAALDRAAQRGARRVTLRVLAHNVQARRLYEASGFVVEGVLRGEFHLDGVDVDDVLMARSL